MCKESENQDDEQSTTSQTSATKDETPKTGKREKKAPRNDDVMVNSYDKDF